MALNISKKIENRPTANNITESLRNQYNITVNQPSQTHFSVEGVQTYSTPEIQALKIRQQKVAKQGQFAKIQTYQVSSKIQFEGVTVIGDNQAATATIKPKSKAGKKDNKDKGGQEGKGEVRERPKTAVVKPSVRNELGRANQKTVKLTKQQQKMQRMQAKLAELTKQYRVHFGEDLKVKKNGNQKQKVKPENDQLDENQEEKGQEGEEQQFEDFEDEEGEQCLPTKPVKKETAKVANKGKGMKKDKKGGNEQEVSMTKADDSFEEVQWQVPIKAIIGSSLKESTHSYSERLGNAVHLLFD